jgi:AbrB family looped-hinge helix DNA binding protein
MKTQMKPKSARPLLARVGASRQVAIPKKLHDELGLSAGDIVEVERKGNQIVLTPKDLVEKGIAEGLEDLKKGRAYGPFSSVKDMLKSLHGDEKPRKKPKRAT